MSKFTQEQEALFAQIRKRAAELDFNDKTNGYLPLPPWVAFPKTEPNSINWRMGAGEDHIRLVCNYLETISENERIQYRERFPTPKEWFPFYEEDEI